MKERNIERKPRGKEENGEEILKHKKKRGEINTKIISFLLSFLFSS